MQRHLCAGVCALLIWKTSKKKIFYELKKREYRDGIKMKGDKIEMGLLHSLKRCMFLVRCCPEGNYTSPILSQRVFIP